jgi:hypothetical protein
MEADLVTSSPLYLEMKKKFRAKEKLSYQVLKSSLCSQNRKLSASSKSYSTASWALWLNTVWDVEEAQTVRFSRLLFG